MCCTQWLSAARAATELDAAHEEKQLRACGTAKDPKATVVEHEMILLRYAQIPHQKNFHNSPPALDLQCAAVPPHCLPPVSPVAELSFTVPGTRPFTVATHAPSLDSCWVVAAGLDGECGSPHSGGLGDASQALDAQDIVRVGVGCSAALHPCAGAPSPKNWLLRTSLIAALALQIALAALQLVSEEVLERNSEGWVTMMADVQR